MTAPRRSLLVTLACLASACADVAGASLDLELASAPAVVTTNAGRTFRGLLDGYREQRLHLRIATGGGEVGYSFAREEIATLTLPGEDLVDDALQLWERGEAAAALPILEALGRQRSRYLPLLDAKQRRPLFVLVQAAEAAGDPHVVIGYTRLLAAHAASPGEHAILRDAELVAHVRLGLRDEARRLAERWCREADPAGASALGWSLLARTALEDGEAGRALWIALQPVVFSSFQTSQHLDACYAIAITAARQLDRAEHAEQLMREMTGRGLHWPPDFPMPAERADRPDIVSIAPPLPPSEETNLTLDEVRKLVAPQRL